MTGIEKKIILFLARIIARPVLLLFRYTLSIGIYRRHYILDCRKKSENIIYTFWHENMLLPLLVHEKQGIHVLVSQHFDGEVIATILRASGYGSIRGSSTRGGKEAFFQMKSSLLARDFEIAFTPDGPRGPRRQAKSGIIRLASETGIPIIMIGVAASRKIRLNSWDRLMVVLPFARCAVVYHEPVYIPARLTSAEMEKYIARLNRMTNDLDKEAEKCLAL